MRSRRTLARTREYGYVVGLSLEANVHRVPASCCTCALLSDTHAPACSPLFVPNSYDYIMHGKVYRFEGLGDEKRYRCVLVCACSHVPHAACRPAPALCAGWLLSRNGLRRRPRGLFVFTVNTLNSRRPLHIVVLASCTRSALYVSFGGLLMRLKASGAILSKASLDQMIYILLKKD